MLTLEEMVREIVREEIVAAGFASHQQPLSTDEKILAEVARQHGVLVADLLGPCRARHLHAARRDAYVGLRKLDWSWKEIGKLFHRDHSTIISATKEPT